jgi:hypothetical protein
MTLDELAETTPFARAAKVPAWTLGCFHRRGITFAAGEEDMATRVIWIQSHGLTGDLRIPGNRPDLRHRASLHDCSLDERIALAACEAGIADTEFAGGQMRWRHWAGFQPYDKFPEPGELRRVGTCLIEWAPSGIYVEDWRAQSGSDGLLAGLRLVSETGADGIARPRGGGLVVAGSHALLVLGRRSPLPAAAPVQEQIACARDKHAIARIAFDCEGSYLRRGQARGMWRVALSTDPFREGKEFPIASGFRHGDEPGRLVQELVEDGCPLRRHWTIDTLLAGQDIPRGTEATQSGRDWLAREAATLLATATTTP